MNKKILFYLQSLVLLGGTIFAYYTVYTDFQRYYSAPYVFPNPLLTTCFYGAFAFLIGLIWSLVLLKKSQDQALQQQSRLNYLIVASTIFAWGSFTYELIRFCLSTTGESLSCSGVPTQNPFATACFYGAAIFLASLLTSLAILKKK